MRTISTNMATEVARVVTSPGYFVEVLFSTPLRFSSRSTIEWGGQVWIARDIDVRNIAFDATGSVQNGSIELGDTDGALAAVLLAQGVADKGVNVWAFYSDAPGVDDPELIFSGSGDGWSLSETSRKVTLTVRQFKSATAFSPRVRITPERGFNFLPVPGTTLSWAGEVFTLEKRS